MSARVPDWVLERYRAGELPAGWTKETIEADPSSRERLEALKKSDEEILAALPAERVGREVRRRAEQSKERRRFVLPTWAPVLATAGVVAVVIPVVLSHKPPTPVIVDDGTERSKGVQPHLEIYRQEKDAAEKLEPGASAHAGDVLQLKVVGATDRYAAVVSTDGNGGVTLHAPAQSGPAAALPDNHVQTLPDAYALDAAPKFERFILVSAPSPFEVSTVINAARAVATNPSAPLALPEGLHQSSFVVRKEIAP